jgi:hypothetical protein
MPNVRQDMWSSKFLYRSVLLVLIGLLTGCGSGKIPTYSADGTVKYADGKPLTTGRVSFRSLDTEKPVTASGQIHTDGTFRLTTFNSADGAVLGRHQAVVAAPIREDDPPNAAKVDRKFASYDSSGLSFTVSQDPEKNHFEIVVAAPGKK